MLIEKDYLELLKLFNKYKVKYCIVGAFAVGFHSIPRYTKDIDLLVEPSSENAEKILASLKDFGFGQLDLNTNDFSQKGHVVQLGHEPVRIDIITSISGCTFARVWKNRKKGNYGNETVCFIGLDELIQAKRAANRTIDQADLEKLLVFKKKRKRK